MKNPNTEKWWDEKFRNGKWTEPDYIMDRLKRYNFLMNILPKDKEFSLLDIGCASGYGLNLIKENFPLASLHGIDFSRVAIDRARNLYPGIRFKYGDIQDCEISRGYDYIVMIRTLEHLTKPFSIIGKCLDYTKSIIVSTPIPDKCGAHISCFDLRSFDDYIFDELPSESGLKLVVYKKREGQVMSEIKRRKDKLIPVIKPYTILDSPRLNNLYGATLYLEEEGIDGSFVECGTMNGGSAGLMASIGKDRQIWLFDSWQGLPEPTKYDVKLSGEKGNKGRARGSREKVEELLFDKLRLNGGRVHFVEGWFEDTITSHIDKVGKIALLHLDCDYYESVKLCLESLYDSIVERGLIIVDDYIDWKGCRKAVDEFVVGANVRMEMAGRVLGMQKGKE